MGIFGKAIDYPSIALHPPKVGKLQIKSIEMSSNIPVGMRLDCKNHGGAMLSYLLA